MDGLIMKFLKRYWNLWGGVLIGIFIDWVKHFSKESMDLISSAIVLTITLIGALTFLKGSFNSNKHKTKKEKEEQKETDSAGHSVSTQLSVS